MIRLIIVPGRRCVFDGEIEEVVHFGKTRDRRSGRHTLPCYSHPTRTFRRRSGDSVTIRNIDLVVNSDLSMRSNGQEIVT